MNPVSEPALDPSHIEIWWSALGAGLVVIACVAILLSLLTAFARDIDRQLQTATNEARGAAAHVRCSDLIAASARLVGDLAGELALQVSVLSHGRGEAS